jgi:hypothetical protein
VNHADIKVETHKHEFEHAILCDLFIKVQVKARLKREIARFSESSYHLRSLTHTPTNSHLQHLSRATMAPSTENSSQEMIPVPPYLWEDSPLPKEEDLRLWQDVADQLEKQQTGESVLARIFVLGILRGILFYTLYFCTVFIHISPFEEGDHCLNLLTVFIINALSSVVLTRITLPLNLVLFSHLRFNDTLITVHDVLLVYVVKS